MWVYRYNPPKYPKSQQVTATSKFNDLDPALECLFGFYKNGKRRLKTKERNTYFNYCLFSIINQFPLDVNKNRNLE